jgi:hypothetical protein
VFTDKDFDLYNEYTGGLNTFQGQLNCHHPTQDDFPMEDTTRNKSINIAKQWIDDADTAYRLNICRGWDMSVKGGEMVYIIPDDFAAAYPWFPKLWGYE